MAKAPKPADGWLATLTASIVGGVTDGFRPVFDKFSARLDSLDNRMKEVEASQNPTDLAPLRKQASEQIQKEFADYLK
jgi:hypothetical protein